MQEVAGKISHLFWPLYKAVVQSYGRKTVLSYEKKQKLAQNSPQTSPKPAQNLLNMHSFHPSRDGVCSSSGWLERADVDFSTGAFDYRWFYYMTL